MPKLAMNCLSSISVAGSTLLHNMMQDVLWQRSHAYYNKVTHWSGADAVTTPKRTCTLSSFVLPKNLKRLFRDIICKVRTSLAGKAPRQTGDTRANTNATEWNKRLRHLVSKRRVTRWNPRRWVSRCIFVSNILLLLLVAGKGLRLILWNI